MFTEARTVASMALESLAALVKPSGPTSSEKEDTACWSSITRLHIAEMRLRSSTGETPTLNLSRWLLDSLYKLKKIEAHHDSQGNAADA